ncbi:MAG: class I SAM-dependent methyltransferase [Pseudomonadota bacterium]
MGWYARHILPRLIEGGCSQPPLMRLREQYVPRARGRVLEVGVGTGLNLRYYDGDVELTALDPAAELTAKARERAASRGMNVELLGVSGEMIPADDARFDALVCTWTLCTIPDPARALAEMHRVVRPGGALYFIEHGLSPEAGVARWQHRIEPLWKRIAGGCHLSREADKLIAAAGFEISERMAEQLPGPKIATWVTHGVALRA